MVFIGITGRLKSDLLYSNILRMPDGADGAWSSTASYFINRNLSWTTWHANRPRPPDGRFGAVALPRKKKKTDKTSTLGDFIWLNNLPSESKLMMCRHLSNWFKLLDTVFVAFTALILTASSRVLTRSSTSSTHGVDEAHSPHEESLRRTSQVVGGNG